MGVLWLVQLVRRKGNLVEIGWAIGLGLLAVFYATYGDGGYGPRKLLIAILGAVAALRLTYHLLRYCVLNTEEEDRHLMLREKWGANAQRNFFIFFQVQGFFVVILSLTFLVIVKNPVPGFELNEMFGVMLWTGAFIGQTIADSQLAEFRSTPENQSKVCKAGLWRYSRHPNYFFEWLMWVAYGAIAVSAPYGGIGFLIALFMLFLILKVVGIPPNERSALAVTPTEYAEYQRTTSKFVPWFCKE